MEQNIESIISTIGPLIIEYGLQFIGAILTLIIGWTASRWAKGATERALRRIPYMDTTLIPFLATIVRIGLLSIVVVAVLNQFGVETTSIIALLGAAGLAIGLALQGTLSNIASGVVLLVLRPFKIEEYIDAGGLAGTVVQIGLFNTELRTINGEYLIVPNSTIANKAITNYSRNPVRRINLSIGISYGDDIKGASEVLLELMSADQRILGDPEPQVLVGSLGSSSVDLVMRCWTSTAESWNVQFDLTRQAKLAIEQAGYTIPFPQQDVHIISKSA